jgi:histidinol phosphatase-like PHP family hydrolase
MKSNLTFILVFFVSIAPILSQTAPFPLTDLHVHLSGKGLDAAITKSKNENIQYGILASAGSGFISNDQQLESYLSEMRKYPMFYVGIQPEGREWTTMFSKEALKKADYIATDAMTFTDEQGRRNMIYRPNFTWIDDVTRFMDYYVNVIVKVLNEEPINIYVNATYLPAQISGRYDSLWTGERMEKVIAAAAKNKIAIEINNRYKIPSKTFIDKAKKAGVKFTIGTNNMSINFYGAEYAIRMINECGLKQQDFWLPATRNGVRR